MRCVHRGEERQGLDSGDHRLRCQRTPPRGACHPPRGVRPQEQRAQESRTVSDSDKDWYVKIRSISLVDPGGGVGGRTPLFGPISFIFMQLSTKKLTK